MENNPNNYNEKRQLAPFLTIDPEIFLAFPNEGSLLLAICALSLKNGYVFASSNYLSNLFGVSRSTVIHWMKKLENKGLITIEQRKSTLGGCLASKITPAKNIIKRFKKRQTISNISAHNSNTTNDDAYYNQLMEVLGNDEQ